MNKLIYLVIIALIGVVGYQSVELSRLKKELIKKSKEPEVIIHVTKVQPNSTSKSDENSSLDTVLKNDFQKIFKDVFSHKEVKESIKEFKKGLNQTINELQKQLKDMDKEGVDIFGELVKELGVKEFKTFKDMGDYYQYVIDVDGEHSKVNIDAKNGYLYIDITSKTDKKGKNSVIKKESKRSYVIKLPDADVEKIKSEYKNKKLYLTIPKKKKITKV